jgi:hypothetical protein
MNRTTAIRLYYSTYLVKISIKLTKYFYINYKVCFFNFKFSKCVKSKYLRIIVFFSLFDCMEHLGRFLLFYYLCTKITLQSEEWRYHSRHICFDCLCNGWQTTRCKKIKQIHAYISNPGLKFYFHSFNLAVCVFLHSLYSIQTETIFLRAFFTRDLAHLHIDFLNKSIRFNFSFYFYRNTSYNPSICIIIIEVNSQIEIFP